MKENLLLMNWRFTGLILTIILGFSLLVKGKTYLMQSHASEIVDYSNEPGESEEEELKNSLEDEYINSERYIIFSPIFDLNVQVGLKSLSLPFISFSRHYPPPNPEQLLLS
ncbi:hypothetical protein [Sphingobacterium sp. 1.A.5]|uniref:hypothetical protein n=1 Tax=Sphingobacterium sp. 1.A.5 TaxID=2044604 RepID=UPI0011817889|nr:hypothetical protein [Sphingobacterium sp. 1.A.5]